MEKYIFKNYRKNFNSVISTDLLKDKECTFYKTLIHHLDEEFIISENVDIVEDNYGKKEYRCFVINNEIYNISRMTNRVLHNIEINILEVLKKIINRMDGIFPSCYVVDIFEYYDKNGNQNIDVVEFNPIHASGIYLYNSVIEKSNDLLHSNLKNISKEFFSKIDECSVDGKVEDHSSILYDVPNSFSCDLRSICKTGNLGLIFSNATISTEDFYRHNEVYNFDSMILIESDEQLYEFTDFSNNYSDKLVEEENNMIEKLLKLNKKKYGTINNPSS